MLYLCLLWTVHFVFGGANRDSERILDPWFLRYHLRQRCQRRSRKPLHRNCPAVKHLLHEGHFILRDLNLSCKHRSLKSETCVCGLCLETDGNIIIKKSEHKLISKRPKKLYRYVTYTCASGSKPGLIETISKFGGDSWPVLAWVDIALQCETPWTLDPSW